MEERCEGGLSASTRDASQDGEAGKGVDGACAVTKVGVYVCMVEVWKVRGKGNFVNNVGAARTNKKP